MMTDQLAEMITIARYILIALAIVGVITLAYGIYYRQRKFIERGAYVLILSIVLSVCGYFIYETTKEKIYNTYITY